MAFYNEDDDNQDPNNQGPTQTGPGSSVISGGQGAAPGTQAPLVSGSPDKGGNFVGLKTYIDANKNQASKLGEQTAGIVSNSINSARDSVSGLNQKFNQAVDQNTVSEDKDALALVGSTPESLSQDQRNTLKKQYNASYKGPNGLEDLGDNYSQALKNSNLANQNIKDAVSESGRGNLIKQINSAPRTKGVTTFDNILLQTGPGANKLQTVAAQNADIKDLMSNSQSAAQKKVGRVDDPNTPDVNEATGAKGTTAQTQADTYKTVQDALGAWKNGFLPKVDSARNTQVDLQNRITQDLGGQDALTQETMDLLGLSPGQYNYNLDLNKYFNPGSSASDISEATVATPEDYNRYAALADLAGEKDLILNPENLSKAGTFVGAAGDKEGLKNALQAADQARNNYYSTNKQRLMDTINAANMMAGGLPGPGSGDPNAIRAFWNAALNSPYGGINESAHAAQNGVAMGALGNNFKAINDFLKQYDAMLGKQIQKA